jgi:hypothetical protein
MDFLFIVYRGVSYKNTEYLDISLEKSNHGSEKLYY